MITLIKIPALLLVLLLQPCLLNLSQLSAQAPKIAEPEPLDQFFFLDSVGDIRPLERQVRQGMVIEGDRSPIRFVQSEPLAFVVRLTSQNVDPATVVRFIQFRPHGKDRVLEQGFSKAVPFDATNYGEESTKIKSKVALGPGEYALSLSGQKESYCFGVDAASRDLK